MNDIALAKAVDQLPCRSLAIDAHPSLRAAQLISKIYPFFIYPILTLAHVDGRYRTARYIAVDNLSARFGGAVQGSPPCAVICLDCAAQPQKLREYGRDFQSSSVSSMANPLSTPPPERPLELAVVIPAYNEVQNVERSLALLEKTLAGCGDGSWQWDC